MPKRIRFLRGLIFTVPLIVALLIPLAAAQNPNGALRGEVQDASGGRIAAANIKVQSPGYSQTRQVLSNERGEFRVEGLLPGPYQVVVTASGFAEATAEVNIVVSLVRDLTVTLKPASVRQAVSVQARTSSITAESVDTASAVHQGAVSAHDLETLPLASRSFANIAYLVPGTEPVEPSDPTKARITAVSVGGSSGLNQELTVDGGDNSDDYIGGFLQNFSPDAIQEFAVRTSQEDADTGRTVGGSVVITTKHGTNEWHGGAAFYERASGMNARYPIENPAPNPKQPFSRQNYIGTLGGPLKKDRVWIFASFEHVHEDASIAYSPVSIMQFNALASLASLGLIPGVSSISVPATTAIPFRDYLATVRFDWAQSPHSQWFIRGGTDNYTTNNNLVQQGTLPSTGTTSGSHYSNLVLSNQYVFSPTWLGSFVLNASGLHHTEARNANYGFALAFPFSSTAQTISGFETFGDNQFVTAVTAFPILRNQEKYQFRYDLSHTVGSHSLKFGASLIHEPVLSGALSDTAETLLQYAHDPTYYAANPQQFYFDLKCVNPPMDVICTATPATNGSFSQNVQRVGLYAQDAWRAGSHLTVNYGLRYDTTFGLFSGSGRSQLENPAYLTLRALEIPLIKGAPHDYRAQFGPRLGLVYSPGRSERTVIRAGIGLYYNDLAQNGWVPALQAVNVPPGPCVDPVANPAGPENAGCIPGEAMNGSGAIIDPHYKTPYAIHASAGMQHAFNEHWTVSADWTHQNGVHAYRSYSYTGGTNLFTPLLSRADPAQANFVPNLDVFKADNRSSYDGLSIRLQGNTRPVNLIANYTLATAKTWGCVLGEIFDYVNGVCDPLRPFASGDYGPSGEDVRHRFVFAGTFHIPGGFELTTLVQAESARPFTITTADNKDRVSVNGIKTSLDQFRGTPYVQADLRVTRPFKIRERWAVMPFIEFFNLFNRNNPGANYVTSVGALPVPPAQAQSGNVTDICTNPACSTTQSITRLNQLAVPAGAFGDFFGPGTTVGIPFAAQLGVRLTF
jgi:hypothetical protein